GGGGPAPGAAGADEARVLPGEVADGLGREALVAALVEVERDERLARLPAAEEGPEVVHRAHVALREQGVHRSRPPEGARPAAVVLSSVLGHPDGQVVLGAEVLEARDGIGEIGVYVDVVGESPDVLACFGVLEDGDGPGV